MIRLSASICLRSCLLGTLLVAVVGCGDSYYHERMTKTLDHLRVFGPFEELLQPEGQRSNYLGASLRFPKSIDATAKGVDVSGVGAVPNQRDLFGYLKLIRKPGFLFGYELPTTNPNPVFGEPPRMMVLICQGTPGVKPEDQLLSLSAMAKSIDMNSPGYVDVQVMGLDGKLLTLKYLSVATTQPNPADGKMVEVRVDSYATIAEGKLLTVDWVAQNPIAATNRFFEAARYAMGTFSFATPPPPMEGAAPMGAAPMGPMGAAPMGGGPAGVPMGAAPVTPK